MKNKIQITGNHNVSNIIQGKTGDITIEQHSSEIILSIDKKAQINTGFTVNTATIFVIVGLIADIITIFTFLTNIVSINYNFIVMLIGILIILVTGFFFNVLSIIKDLKKKKFSTIIPDNSIPSKYVFLLNHKMQIVLVKLQMICPKCNSDMKILQRQDKYYYVVCDRNSMHNISFDFTELDGI